MNEDSRTPALLYEPHSHRGWRPAIWLAMVRELVECRGLIWRLFLREFKARYKQTLLGVLWAVILPVVAVGSFVLLNNTGVMTIGPLEDPYILWALLGLTVWQIFAGGLVACTQSIVAGGTMVTRINFPREALVLSSLGQIFVETAIRIVLVAAVFLYYGVAPSWMVLLTPLALLPILLLTLGLGFILALFNALARDTAHVVTLATTFLLFLTPVLYPAPPSPLYLTLSRFNPLDPLVNGVRSLILNGTIADPRAFALWSAVTLVLFLLSWRLFHLAEIRMAERVGAQ